VGVDTHADLHVAAALDPLGRMLGRLESGRARAGTRNCSSGRTRSVRRQHLVSKEPARTAPLGSFLIDAGCEVIEINRPDRRARRGHGKSDSDRRRSSSAIGGWLVVRSASPSVTTTESALIRTSGSHVAPRSRCETQVGNQIHALVVTAPDSLRHQLRDLPLDKLVAVTAAARPGTVTTPSAASKLALRSLAIAIKGSPRSSSCWNRELGALTMEVAPGCAASSVLSRCRWGSPGGRRRQSPSGSPFRRRLRQLVRVSPVPASWLGKTKPSSPQPVGGDPIANKPLGAIAMVRLTW